MAPTDQPPAIQSGRLTAGQYDKNFCDLHPLLTAKQATAEAGRCYFCFDAPCMNACPTTIDIALFIRQIATGDIKGSAKTIFSQNIMGAMCARVCPTEQLCEQVCVRNDSEQKPVSIGRLQRYATENAIVDNHQFFKREPDSGETVAVVGAGPAGLACAHRLAMHGHHVEIFEAKPKPGGLNEYGIATYKALDDIAAREAEYILGIGNIEVRYEKTLGKDFTLESLRSDYGAVFLALGMAGVNQLDFENENLSGVMNAVDYIADLRQTDDYATLPTPKRAVIIGGGMTAIDMAIQIKLLGSPDVTLVYRRDQRAMKASLYEQELAQTKGVNIIFNASPKRLMSESGRVTGIELTRTITHSDDQLSDADETFILDADMVFKAIGQTFDATPIKNDQQPDLKAGKLHVDDNRRTSLNNVWAGGDCISGGEDLTVAAVNDGRIAAIAIDQYLSTRKQNGSV